MKNETNLTPVNKTKLCVKCKSEIPHNATVCSHCRSKQFSPKGCAIVLLLVLIVIILAIALNSVSDENSTTTTAVTESASSSNNNSSTETTQPASKSTETTTTTEATTSTEAVQEVFGLNETAQASDFKITVLKVEKSTGSEFNRPNEGNIFIGTKFQIENTADKDVSISSIMLFDCYVDDVKAGISFSAAVAFPDGTLEGTIPPGKKLVGWIGVEAPEDSNIIEFQVRDGWFTSKKTTFIIPIE